LRFPCIPRVIWAIGGKVLLFGVRNLPSLVETEISLSLLKEEDVYLPGIGSILHLETLELKL
ncbi:hypothetical protein P9W88_30205, partial [Bacillus cereus]|nr:hypothetical protein [Bacillus cereus]